MAAPKKRTARSTPRRARGPTRRSESRDQYTVVLEDIRSKFDVFGEALQGVQAGLHDVKSDLQGVKSDLQNVKSDLQDVKSGLLDVQSGLARHDERFDRTDGDLRFLRAAVTAHSTELRDLRAGQARIEAALDKKVDRDEVQAMIAQGLAGR